MLIVATMMPIALFGFSGCDDAACLSLSAMIKNSEERDINSLNTCRKDEMVTLFANLDAFAQEKIDEIDSEIKRLENNHHVIGHLKEIRCDYEQQLELIHLIMQRDSEGFKKIDPARFNHSFLLALDERALKNNLNGRISFHCISGHTMLALVLFHSATNTAQDNEKTLAMLKVMLDQGADVHSGAERVYWVKDKPEDKVDCEYSDDLSLVELARLYSFPQAVELLVQYGA